MKKYILFCLIAILATTSCIDNNQEMPKEYTGTALWISDGDTFTLKMSDGTWKTIRLYGIDAPESSQEYGNDATQQLVKLIGRKHVKVEIMDIDRYNRVVGKVYYGKQYINLVMIETGNAWWYKKYAPEELDLSEAEKQAKLNNAGLWQSDNLIPPWQYRKAN